MEKKPRKPRKDLMRKEAVGFSLKIERPSFPVVLEEDIERMQKYQHALVDELIYPEEKLNDGGFKSTQLIMEIRAVESWLKVQVSAFINNNNRKFAQ